MKRPYLTSLALLGAAPIAFPLTAADFQIADAAEFARCVPADANAEKLAGGFDFIEGPVWIGAGGYRMFSDIPRASPRENRSTP